MCIITPNVEHKADLPYCCYDSKTHTITLRLITSYITPQSITVLHGDPYEWDKVEDTYIWRFQETTVYKQFYGTQKTVWKTEIAMPEHRRLKYGFRIKTEEQDYYFSENGLETYCLKAVNRAHNHFFYPFIYESDDPSLPSWAEHTVWYQIFPDRFCKGAPCHDSLDKKALEDWENNKPSHRSFSGGNLKGILQKLPYLQSLGVNALYLTPVFKSPSNHKYDTQDYFCVDGSFGTINELKELASEVHKMGMRIMLDAVFNHIGSLHPFWQDVLKNQEKSAYKDYFFIHSFPVKEKYEHYERIPYDTFAFSFRMPKWNTENPDVRSYLLQVASFWIKECDIDGLRLDVANEISKQFLRELAALVRNLKKDFYINAELWHDGSSWINNKLFDAVMNYPLSFAIIDYFVKRTISAQQFTDKLVMALTRYSDAHNRVAFNLLDSHDTVRLLTAAGGDKLALRNAFTMLFLLPGSPCIYYGTEIGMEGGHDPDNRRVMIWDEAKQDSELLEFFKRLIAFRKAHINLINHSTISYQEIDGAHCWHFAFGNEVLKTVYTDGCLNIADTQVW